MNDSSIHEYDYWSPSPTNAEGQEDNSGEH